MDQPTDAFEAFVQDEGKRLHRVLCAHYGPELGPEVTAEALAYAWEHWARLASMSNPTGYLYRVAQSEVKRRRRRRWPSLEKPRPQEIQVEPELWASLRRLSPSQRTAVILVHALDWSLQDAADSMSISVSTLRNHLRRGLDHLNTMLGADPNGPT